jgi:hypothetical protein
MLVRLPETFHIHLLHLPVVGQKAVHFNFNICGLRINRGSQTLGYQRQKLVILIHAVLPMGIGTSWLLSPWQGEGLEMRVALPTLAEVSFPMLFFFERHTTTAP